MAFRGLTAGIITNMDKGWHVSLGTIVRICEALNCDLAGVIEVVKNKK